MPKISVIVPVYNVEKYLNRCVESILNQTFTDFELILVDDGSPDNCPLMCDNWAKKDNRIIVIHKENGGLSNARNSGIDVSSAPFITFVDSDDWLNPNIIESIMDLQEKYKADIVEFAKKDIFNDNDIKDIEVTTPDTVETFELSGKEMILRLYNGGSTVCWGKLYNSKLFQNNKFTEGIIYEDTLLLPILLFKSERCVVTNQIGYYYNRSNDNSIMHRPFSLKNLDSFYVHQKNREFYLNNNLTEAFLVHDTTYAFVLINLMKKVRKFLGKHNESYISLNAEYKKLFLNFLKNPYFIWKQKLLLIWYRLTL